MQQYNLNCWFFSVQIVSFSSNQNPPAIICTAHESKTGASLKTLTYESMLSTGKFL